MGIWGADRTFCGLMRHKLPGKSGFVLFFDIFGFAEPAGGLVEQAFRQFRRVIEFQDS